MAELESFINFDNESEFLTANGPTFTDMGVLSESKFVIIYQDNADSQHGTAKIGTVSGTDVIFGDETEFFSLDGHSNAPYVAALDASGFVVIYQDESDSGHGTAKVGTVSGTTINFGPEFEYLSTGRAAYDAVVQLDSTHFVVAYSDQGDSSKGKVRLGTVSGTTITFGDSSTFHLLSATTEIVLGRLSSSGFVVAYKEGASQNYHGTARIGTVSGTTISFGPDAEFDSTDNGHPYSLSVDSLSSSGFVLAYGDTFDSNHGSVKFGTVSGTSITFGSESEFLSVDGTLANRIVSLDSSSFVVMYKDGSDSGHGTTKIGIVNGTDIVFTDEYEFLRVNGSNNLSLIMLNPQKIIVAYTDFSDSNHGTVKIGTLGLGSSVDLYIDAITASVESSVSLKIIHHLTRTGDHFPQLIGSFGGDVSSVNIKVWDIVNGRNILVPVENNVCYTIGDTNKWGWSTENLSFASGYRNYHYYFEMISNTFMTYYGEFFLTVPERSLWVYI